MRWRKKTKDKWNKIVDSKEEDLAAVAAMIQELRDADVRVYLNVNNHYEGSAPLTIARITELLEMDKE